MDLIISSFIPGNTMDAGNDCLIDQLIKKRYFNNTGNFFSLKLNSFQFGPFAKPAIQQKVSMPCQ